jgi:hypothetical protein
MSNVKNYTEQGGEKTVIGGTLEITEDGEVLGLPAAAFQADSTAVDVAGVVANFNALLAKLIAAGLMTAE